MQHLPFKSDFVYKHDNPYHERLDLFNEFVLRDKEGEIFQHKWNREVFKRDAPLIVEIGSGFGDYMMEYCKKYPAVNFVGMDYRFKRSYTLARKLDKMPAQEKNFRFLRAKGERIAFLFGESEVDQLLLFCPDPWPKTKQTKRRIFWPHFLSEAYTILKPGGLFLIKTDHDDYARQMREVIDASPSFNILFASDDLYGSNVVNPLTEIKTKFERIFIAQEKTIKGFIIQSKKGS